jgi:branched-chain amino acid transport system ATP-binding protein
MSVAGINVLVEETRAAIDAAKQPLLSVRGVKTFYGNIIALKGVDLDVYEGEIVTLIGANGAGKSTLMMTIFGSPQAREGTITYAGRNITRLPTHEIARLNIAQAPEGRRIFPRMTVFENLQMGASVNDFAHFDEDLERVCATFPRLKERLHQRGGTLSGGEQQMLAIARALLMNPRLVVMDEPSEGLAPLIVDQLIEVLRALPAGGTGVLLVEQNLRVATEVAEEVAIMVTGRITTSMPARRIAEDKELQRRYLGVAAGGH